MSKPTRLTAAAYYAKYKSRGRLNTMLRYIRMLRRGL